MKLSALLAALFLPMAAQAREPVPPSRWTQNYIPSLQDWQAALLYNGASFSAAMAAMDAAKLNRNGDTSINQTIRTPKITGGSLNGVLQVASQSALFAMSVSDIGSNTLAYRQGYYTPGDGGDAIYTLSASACSLNSGAGDGGSQIAAPGDKCWVATFPSGTANAKVWGAYFDSQHDDAPYLQAAINWAVQNAGDLVLPCGYSYFNSPLKAAGGKNGWTIRGKDGGECSILVYNGANTTNDIFVVGDIGTADRSYGVTITGFRLDSNTQMTAGDGMHLWHLLQSTVDPVISGQYGNGQFWNGIHFDEVDIVRVPKAYFYGAANDVVLVNGSKQSESWYANYVGEVRIGSGKIGPSDPQLQRGGSGQYPQIGLHVAGSVGGLSVDDTDIIANHHNVVMDNSVTGLQNQSLMLGPGAYTDSSVDDNIVLNDTGSVAVPGLGGTKRFFDYGWNGCAGCASGKGNGVTIQNFTNGAVVLAGYAIQGANGYGVYDEDATAYVSISSSEIFMNNSGPTNIGSSVAGVKLASNNPTIMNGTAYDSNSLTSTELMYGGPYGFIPALHFNGANARMKATTVGNYTLDGRNVRAEFSIKLTSLGTSTGNASIAGLPFGVATGIGAVGGGGGVYYATGMARLIGPVTLSMDSGGTGFAGVTQWGASGTEELTNANFTSSSEIRGSITYIRP